MKTKITMYALTAAVVAGLSLTIYLSYRRIDNLQTELAYARNNEKAYIAENDSIKSSNRVFMMTIEQLECSKDSIIRKMDSLKKELRIRDSDLAHMQYLLSEARKKDTIRIRDTLFRDPELSIDTTMKDRWYTLNVGLRFPNIIMIEPSFISEKYIVTRYKKETVNPPKKCFLARWFQRKHKIVEVEVIENNPYIRTRKQKFIEIIDKRKH